MSDEKRTAHPYHMYDAISQQPAAFGEIATRSRPEVRRLAADLAGAGQLYLVGIGTSLHAAQVGEHLFRVAVGDLPTRAYHAFDFARFGPVLRRNDVVIGISHRGNKLYTRDALQKAAQAGCVTAIITGRGGKVDGAGVRDVFETVPQDRSSAHTVSYVGAIAALALIAGETAARPPGTTQPSASLFPRLSGWRSGVKTKSADWHGYIRHVGGSGWQAGGLEL